MKRRSTNSNSIWRTSCAGNRSPRARERLAEKVAQTIETLQGSVEMLESNLDVDGAEDAPEDR